MRDNRLAVLVDATQARDLHSGVARRLISLWRAVVDESPPWAIGFACLPDTAEEFQRAFPGHTIQVLPPFGTGPLERLRRINPFLGALRKNGGWDWLLQDGLLPADRRSIPCIHDLRVLTPGASFWRRIYARTVAFPKLWTLSAGVMTVSRSMKQELVARVGLKEEQVHVIPNGVDPEAFGSPDLDEQILRKLDLKPGGFRLFVGHVEQRKNLPFLLEVHRRLMGEGQGRTLVIATHLRPLKGSSRRIPGLLNNAVKVRLLDAVDDRILGALYRHASVFLLPSLLEGFSMTPAEALALGCSVVASDLPAHRELLPEDALLDLDPSKWCGRVLEWEGRPRPCPWDGFPTWSGAAGAMIQVLNSLSR